MPNAKCVERKSRKTFKSILLKFKPMSTDDTVERLIVT